MQSGGRRGHAASGLTNHTVVREQHCEKVWGEQRRSTTSIILQLLPRRRASLEVLRPFGAAFTMSNCPMKTVPVHGTRGRGGGGVLDYVGGWA